MISSPHGARQKTFILSQSNFPDRPCTEKAIRYNSVVGDGSSTTVLWKSGFCHQRSIPVESVLAAISISGSTINEFSALLESLITFYIAHKNCLFCTSWKNTAISSGQYDDLRLMATTIRVRPNTIIQTGRVLYSLYRCYYRIVYYLLEICMYISRAVPQRRRCCLYIVHSLTYIFKTI